MVREQGSEEVWYTFAPTLVQAIPKETLTSIMRVTKPPLNPANLIPALLAATSDQVIIVKDSQST